MGSFRTFSRHCELYQNSPQIVHNFNNYFSYEITFCLRGVLMFEWSISTEPMSSSPDFHRPQESRL